MARNLWGQKGGLYASNSSQARAQAKRGIDSEGPDTDDENTLQPTPRLGWRILLGFLPTFLQHATRDHTYEKGNACRYENKIIEIANNGDKIRNQGVTEDKNREN
jgi:hypothetical protein